MSSSSRIRAAFTLIELLTVIAIIAILMGLLFPVVGMIKEHTRRVQAKADMAQIVAAVKHFYTEYSKYPMPAANTGANKDVSFGDNNNSGQYKSHELFDTLRAIDTNQNTRRITYYEGQDAKDL